MRCCIDGTARRLGLVLLGCGLSWTASPLPAVPGATTPGGTSPEVPPAVADPDAQTWSEERCLRLAMMLGEASTRGEALEALASATEFSAAIWVRLLSHPALEVRLGALDVLEDRVGSDLGYDPWEPDPNRRHAASQNWEEWLAGGGASAVPFQFNTPFREDSMRVWLADLLSGDSVRTERALSRMQPHHREAIGSIEAHFGELGDSAPGLRARLKEAQYRLLLSAAAVREGRRIARLLATGNRDEKVEALDLLEGAPVSTMPLVGDGLRDDDPLVRERAVDLLLRMGKGGALPLLRAHLENDDDPNVLHAALRGLGKIEGAGSVRLLVPYLEGDDEDDVAAALQSLSLLGEAARAVKDSVLPCLDHHSWRVRAAALQFFIKSRAAIDEKRLILLLDDEDSFVRSSAVATIASVKSSSSESFSSSVEEALVAAVAKRPDLLGPVLRAFSASKRMLPEAILKTLGEAPPDLLVMALPSLSPGNPQERVLLEKTATNPDRDLAAAALATLASMPESSERTRRLVVDALLGESEENREIVLSRIKLARKAKVTSNQAWRAAVDALSSETGSTSGSGATPSASSSASSSASPRADGSMGDLLSAFGASAEEPAAPSPDPLEGLSDAFGIRESPSISPADSTSSPTRSNPPAPLNDLASAFLGEDSPDSPKAADGVHTSADALFHLVDSAPPGQDAPGRISYRAACLLLSSGDPRPVPRLVDAIGNLSVQDRAELADLVDNQPHPGFLPLWKILVADESSAVRRASFRGAVDTDYTVLFRYLLNEALSPGHPAEPSDLYSSDLEYLAGNRETGKWVAEVGRELVSGRSDTRSRVFGLVMLRSAQGSGDTELLEDCLEDSDYWVRRAAAFALGIGGAKSFPEQVGRLADDDSVWVREAAAAALGRNLVLWTHRFSETEEMKDAKRLSATDYGFFSDRSSSLFATASSRSRLAPEVAGTLLRLTRDISERVRLAAWVALLANGEPVDAAAVATMIAGSPERTEWAARFADWIDEGGEALGQDQREAVLLIARTAFDTKTLSAVEAGIGGGGGVPLSLDFVSFTAEPTDRSPTDEAVAAPAPASPAAASPATGAPKTIRLLFFQTPGCHECDEVREDLKAMQREFPELRIDEHNIRDTSAVLLNEALSTRFRIDSRLRLATPAVFMQEGALIKSEISRPALADLIAKTLAVGETPSWHGVEEAELAASKIDVESRFAAIGLVGVFLAGLLDGVNPCAFATIIFFLSYLQVARRSPREILAVGAAFILSVFLTYFVLGLGLVEIVSRIDSLRTAGRLLNLLLACACLYVAVASFRDARLARAGRLAEMSLQLPGFLKERIRSVVRSGAKSRRFVAAAFLSGIAISVLELACTGQVYLPTIVYAMKSGYDRAVWFLLLYNIAFITPLVLVFVLAWKGMRSETLLRFQQRRTALVKTALGFLFLFLFFALLVSGRLWG